MDRGLACRGRCEPEVRRLLDLRDFSFSQPNYFVTSVRMLRNRRLRIGVINLVIGIALMALWYVFGQYLFGILGVLPLLLGIWRLTTAGDRVSTDQFRLCPHCGYNMTGNTTGKCPECGSFA